MTDPRVSAQFCCALLMTRALATGPGQAESLYTPPGNPSDPQAGVADTG